MTLPASSRCPLTPDLSICRVLNGMWQVSGGHGRIHSRQAIASMFDYFDAGFTTWDLADHYGPAEDFMGEFRRQLAQSRGENALTQVQALTKWVPRPGPMTRRIVEENIDRALQRMDTDCLDLLQFHWWEYDNDQYLVALEHLADLQKAGKIKHLALTNFDTHHLKIILDQGIAIVANQVQYSLIDRRPAVKMAVLCQEANVQLLAYGTLCGGLLSAAYLSKSEPRSFQLSTVSQRKYKQMIDTWGGWSLFQALLQVLQKISQKHQVSIANVADRFILDQPAVAGVIVGVRLGLAEHIVDNAQLFDFGLDAEDRQQIEQVCAQSQDLWAAIGDCGDEYRR